MESQIKKLNQNTENRQIARTIERGRVNGRWLTTTPLLLNGTEMSNGEFNDNVAL